MTCSVLMHDSLLAVERHHGRLIFLEYVGEGEADTTVMMVGKGITYDTGGLDIKGKATVLCTFDVLTNELLLSSWWHHGNN